MSILLDRLFGSVHQTFLITLITIRVFILTTVMMIRIISTPIGPIREASVVRLESLRFEIPPVLTAVLAVRC